MTPRHLIMIVLLLGTAGCSPLSTAVDPTHLEGYDMLVRVTVPPVRGRDGCGAQALGAALAFATPDADAAALADALPWHDVGATPVDLLLAARQAGAKATIAAGTWESLHDDVAARRIAIVMIDAGPEVPTLTGKIPTKRVMHWAVVTGMRLDGNALLLGAPEGKHHVVTRDVFLARWDASDRCVITIEPAS